MKQCDCLNEINQQMNISKGTKNGSIVDFDMISGKTLSEFEYKEKNGKVERMKTIRILHSFCPFCGKPYKENAKSLGVIMFPGTADVGSYLCMPSYKNVPSPSNSDWKLVECPKCGRGCWESDRHRELMKENPELHQACTECAIKAGISGKEG